MNQCSPCIGEYTPCGDSLEGLVPSMNQYSPLCRHVPMTGYPLKGYIFRTHGTVHITVTAKGGRIESTTAFLS